MPLRSGLLKAAALAVLLAACGPAGAATPAGPANTPTSLPTVALPTDTATIVPTITETPMPSAPPTRAPASPTPPAPTAGPAPAGSAAPGMTATEGPFITSFTASAASVKPGDHITLSWQSNVERVAIKVVLQTGNYGRTFDQPGSGSMDFQVDPKERNPFQVQLVAGPDGKEVYKDLLFKIICPDAWFVPNGPSACPNPVEQGDWVAEWFEHGYMVWIGAEKIILVIRDDGLWTRYEDTWKPGDMDNDPTLTPPAGLVQPVRGFGKVWREGTDRQALGWALQPESALPITYQCDTAYKSAVCVLHGPAGLVWLNIWGGGWKADAP